MDKEQLAQLLQASQIRTCHPGHPSALMRPRMGPLLVVPSSVSSPDTEKVKAVTAELQKNYYSQPQSLLLLTEIAVSHNDPAIRQLASVQAQRLVPKHWLTLPADQRDAARNHLLESAVGEQSAAGRHAKCRLLARAISTDLEKESESGPGSGSGSASVSSLLALVSQDNQAAREVGSYTLYAVLEEDPTHFHEQVPQLLNVLKATIQDPTSSHVRLNSVKAIGSILMLVDPEDDQESLASVQSFVQPIVEILKAAIEAEDDEQYKPIFEILQNFLAYDPAFLAHHLKDLIQFFIDLASNKQVDDEARSQALSFLAQCARYRRMKIQSMKDMGAQLMVKSMHILTEVEDEADPDDTSPAKTALSLIDQLASDLPPRQVIVPLLDHFAQFARHPDPGFRKAAILALGTSAEGAPDFIATQLKSLLPVIVELLNDRDDNVRYAALIGLIHIADEMADELAPQHEDLIAALLRNLEAATQDGSKKAVGVIRSVCSALDSLLVGDGLEPDVMKTFGPKLIVPMGKLLNHDDHGIKAAAAGAIGAIAFSMGGDDFKPYFEEVMAALGNYVTVTGDDDTLALRSSVCDAMGRIAGAVGPEAFQPYVVDLMKASEEALSLDSARLKETSFILWASLSKVYGLHFSHFLPGVFKGLFECLDAEDEELSIPGLSPEDAPDGVVTIGGRRIKVKPAEDEVDQVIAMGGGGGGDGDDDDDDDWIDDLAGVTAVDMEQEIALEVVGDLVTHSCDAAAIKEYLEPAMEKILPHVESAYDGSRKAALATLWRSYARVWQLMEEQTGQKWQAGIPLKHQPDATLTALGSMVAKATLMLWADDNERDVITEINRNVGATLKACGPAILTQEDMLKQAVTVLGTIITRSHPCQQDLGDEEEEQDAEGGSSEFDWLVIDTALDVILGLATALGPDFAELWKVFEKPVLKFASSQEGLERSTAVGVIAESIKFMANAVTPFTGSLLPVLFHRLSDEDTLARSNAAYAIGQLIFHSADTNATFPRYTDILHKLEPLLQIREARLVDNVSGCICRMIDVNPDPALVEKVLPAVLDVLPLSEDFEENEPIYRCIFKLYDQQNPAVQALTPRVLPILHKVLSPPEEQLEPETRALVQKLVQGLS
ncbi:karyopherin Kap123 [Sodiomyces alkalinus F11]|uniref:Karyopherin Kap123 n=1 Tax=Sodiomyces alkalinus (strain CBS 110278 / VKM F-3762 / F11) TaxID=1314773 RepID=A0A3N2PPI6_SODAK|nr:karyopherin Kap123 [Sodiomyces alkalinus F11]ROT36421.1 karyopherin Kap123 [Sodiomyces alkalinus F11]